VTVLLSFIILTMSKHFQRSYKYNYKLNYSQGSIKQNLKLKHYLLIRYTYDTGYDTYNNYDIKDGFRF